MNTTTKGNKLEDKLHTYLKDQLDNNELLYDLYPASACRLFKKPSYYCKEREADVEFDVVVEVRRIGRPAPHLYLVFECKNHGRALEDSYVRNFSDQIRSVFGQAVKGVIVTSNRLQSGAEKVALNRRLGIVKFDENGLDVIADRAVRAWPESQFVQSQLVSGTKKTKSLKYSSLVDGVYCNSFLQMLLSIEAEVRAAAQNSSSDTAEGPRFLPEVEIKRSALKVLSKVAYFDGEVDVEQLCDTLSLKLSYTQKVVKDAEGNNILGTANFDTRSIVVNQNGNRNRERFTIAHEIGHFHLQHDRYLRSETIIEQDFYVGESVFNYGRLEFQANLFASYLLLPDPQFARAVSVQRQRFGTFGRGFGYIYVDDQPCNLVPYYQMISELSQQFGASKLAIEVRLKRSGLLTDNRECWSETAAGEYAG